MFGLEDVWVVSRSRDDVPHISYKICGEARRLAKRKTGRG